MSGKVLSDGMIASDVPSKEDSALVRRVHRRSRNLMQSNQLGDCGRNPLQQEQQPKLELRVCVRACVSMCPCVHVSIQGGVGEKRGNE